MLHKISNWDDAYDNGNNIPAGHRWPGLWGDAAAAFRKAEAGTHSITHDIAYGPHERQRYDLITPQGKPKGLVVFFHGGFWHKLDKSFFTHLAKGCVKAGWAFAIPSYRLCPEVKITDITVDAASAISDAAVRIEGPIRLIGHSAGGHLVTMMGSDQSLLPAQVQSRIEHIVSVSGLHDLRPLMTLQMNSLFNLDMREAKDQSPALHAPLPNTRLTCWVGAAERAEFLRQNDLLANIWKGLGAETSATHQPDRHHFNILDDLEDQNGLLTRVLLG